jgi:hypothetical protein
MSDVLILRVLQAGPCWAIRVDGGRRPIGHHDNRDDAVALARTLASCRHQVVVEEPSHYAACAA